jgi:hypothetical protein
VRMLSGPMRMSCFAAAGSDSTLGSTNSCDDFLA